MSHEASLKKVTFELWDIIAIPPHFRNSFDLTWPGCVPEHMILLLRRLRFIRSSLGCLKSDGVSFYTKEFNLTSDNGTVDIPSYSIYKRQVIVAFISAFMEEGFIVEPLESNIGDE